MQITIDQNQRIQQFYQLIHHITYFNYKTNLKYITNMQSFVAILQRQMELMNTNRFQNKLNSSILPLNDFIESLEDNDDKLLAKQVFKEDFHLF